MKLIVLLLRILIPCVTIIANCGAKTSQFLLGLILVEGTEILWATRGYIISVQVLVKIWHRGEIFEFLNLVLNCICTHPLIKSISFLLIWSIATPSLGLKIVLARNRKSLGTFHGHERLLVFESERSRFEAIYGHYAFLTSIVITGISLFRLRPHRNLHKLNDRFLEIGNLTNRFISIHELADLLLLRHRWFPWWLDRFLLSAAQSHDRVTRLKMELNQNIWTTYVSLNLVQFRLLLLHSAGHQRGLFRMVSFCTAGSSGMRASFSQIFQTLGRVVVYQSVVAWNLSGLSRIARPWYGIPNSSLIKTFLRPIWRDRVTPGQIELWLFFIFFGLTSAPSLHKPLGFPTDIPHILLHKVDFSSNLYSTFWFDLLLDQLFFLIKIPEDSCSLILELLDLLDGFVLFHELFIGFRVVHFCLIKSQFGILVRLIWLKLKKLLCVLMTI